MWKRGSALVYYYYNSVVVIVFDRLIPPSKDERDTNCRNELLFKSLVMLQYSTPTRSFTAVQEFLFVIIFIHSFPKNHNRFLFPAFHTLNPSTSSTVFKSGNISENPMHAYTIECPLQNNIMCIPLRIGLLYTSSRNIFLKSGPFLVKIRYGKNTYEIIVMNL